MAELSFSATPSMSRTPPVTREGQTAGCRGRVNRMPRCLIERNGTLKSVAVIAIWPI